MYLNLKAEIIRKGFTISSFAEKLKIAEKTLRNKINGVTEFTWSECLAIREALGSDVSLEELFDKREEESA